MGPPSPQHDRESHAGRCAAARAARRGRVHGRRGASGFTLIEAALTTVIVSTGVLAILAAQQAYHRKNDWAQRTGTAAMLANEIRELMMTLPTIDPLTGKNPVGPKSGQDPLTYNDVYDFAGDGGTGVTFTTPINALRQPIANMDGWSQFITVKNVLPDNLGTTFTQTLGSTNTLRVTVTVRYQAPGAAAASTMTQLTWIVYE